MKDFTANSWPAFQIQPVFHCLPWYYAFPWLMPCSPPYLICYPLSSVFTSWFLNCSTPSSPGLISYSNPIINNKYIHSTHHVCLWKMLMNKFRRGRYGICSNLHINHFQQLLCFCEGIPDTIRRICHFAYMLSAPAIFPNNNNKKRE